MTMMNTRTPKTAAMVPGEDRPEPETNIRAVKTYVDVNMKYETVAREHGELPASKRTLALVEAKLTSLAIETLMQ